MSAAFVDTNVLVYAADAGDRRKHDTARALLRSLGPERTMVSAQVLAEYASVMTHPRKGARRARDVAAHVARMHLAWRVVSLNAEIVLAALEAQERWGLAYYDAQIWASAVLGGVSVVLSEDFSDGATLGGIRFADPFAGGFDIGSL